MAGAPNTTLKFPIPISISLFLSPIPKQSTTIKPQIKLSSTTSPPPPAWPPMSATSAPAPRSPGSSARSISARPWKGLNSSSSQPACLGRKPGMSRDDLFTVNARIVTSLCTAIAKYCPNAIVNMISKPVNSTVPIAAEVFKKAGTYDERKLFGVTTLDVVRARTFYAGKANVVISVVNVSVVGGHAGVIILPLFSQATPAANSLSEEDIKALTN